MKASKINIQSEEFDVIIDDIKRRNLSRDNMPKLIVGTGLSCIYGVPGMKELANHLNQEIAKSTDDIKAMWDKRYADVMDKGLEAGLGNISEAEIPLVELIQNITAKYILAKEEKLHKEIWNRDTGFCKLLVYLTQTISVNERILDIMTPNYDRIIEIICDKLQIGVITGFRGGMYKKFDANLLKNPSKVYNCRDNTWVRIFKPHGSINWINEKGHEYLTNDAEVLKKKTKYIEIVTPGSSKYKAGLINSTFRNMREDFNALLNPGDSYSLLFFGYGFNDDHFDTALFDSFQKNVLIISRDVKSEIVDKALKNKNITIFYHENNKDCMIYKAKKYVTDMALWDIEQFADVFLG